jgi:tRNA-specific 2-thiouridylase
VADKVESQDICFVPGRDYADFVRRRSPDAPQTNPGPLVDGGGRVLGRHKGSIHYTVGQRRGLGVASTEPLYVLRVEARANRVVVGARSELGNDTLTVRELNWVSCEPPREPLEAEVKVRYRAPALPAVVTPLPRDRARVTFAGARPAAAPGQSAVFYQDDVVLGGGVIDSQGSA